MDIGLFMMPLHKPSPDFSLMLDEYRAAGVFADTLGFTELWVGEHYSSSAERIVSPLQYFASLIDSTKQIKFATGVLTLPHHHPARIAGDVAQFDHASRGRFIMGVGTGSLPTDFELFGTPGNKRNAMMMESIDLIHKLWKADKPFEFKGEFWSVKIETMNDRFGYGHLLKPYQKPYPPLAISVMSPNSSTAREAGEKGWGMASANFIHENWLKSHWEQYVIGCDNAGHRPDRSQWRVARSILVTDTDAEAAEYLGREGNSFRWYFNFIYDETRNSPRSLAMKADETVPDEALTLQNCLDNIVISGSPRTVLDRLVALVDKVGGPFGTLLLGYKQWDDPAVHRKSWRLLVEEVMPKLRHYATAREARG
jgi:alkanesulfonate monooxygenase SsuD/methylene tetrahydromethanopterin reductase-like flavin-dependent oxidoreductase (luciferase family)